jgi:hypothetical protein
LEDKSNVTRSPKKVTDTRMEHQQDIGEERGVDVTRRPSDVSNSTPQQPATNATAAQKGIKSRPPLRSTSSIDELASNIESNVVSSYILSLTLQTLKIYSDESNSPRTDGGSIFKDDQTMLPTKKTKTSSRRKRGQMKNSPPSILTNKTFHTIPSINAVDETASIEQTSERGSRSRKPAKIGMKALKASSTV